MEVVVVGLRIWTGIMETVHDSRRRRWALYGAAVCVAAALLVSRPALLAPSAQHPAPADPAEAVMDNPVAALFRIVSQRAQDLPEVQRWEIAGTVHTESERHGFDPLMVLAMIDVESSFSPTARGPRGAVGLTQLMPRTARALAERRNVVWEGPAMLAHPVTNIRLGLLYLAELERRFDDLLVAMAAYNMGPTRASRLAPEKVRRTGYVRRILARYEDFLQEHSA